MQESFPMHKCPANLLKLRRNTSKCQKTCNKNKIGQSYILSNINELNILQ